MYPLTASSSLSRRMLLKAFWKSTLTSALLDGRWARYTRLACIAASTPAAMPKPSWWGAYRSGIEARAWRQAHLEISLLSVQPTAMGRTPPLLVRAVSLAPKKKGRMEGGVFPSKTRVTRPTRADKRDAPPSPAEGLVRSLRCWGSRPSEPPPEPFGKDDMTFRIVAMSTVKGRGVAGSRAGMKESEEGEGCFALRASRVTVLCSANPSSLLTSLTAHL